MTQQFHSSISTQGKWIMCSNKYFYNKCSQHLFKIATFLLNKDKIFRSNFSQPQYFSLTPFFYKKYICQSSIIHKSQKVKPHANVHELVNEQNWIYTIEYYSTASTCMYRYMQQHRGMSTALCLVKEAKHKSTYFMTSLMWNVQKRQI